MLTVGDNVRYLNAVGGGTVTKIQDKIAYVLEPDGFETPVPVRELVVITPRMQKDENSATIKRKIVPSPEPPVREVLTNEEIKKTEAVPAVPQDKELEEIKAELKVLKEEVKILKTDVLTLRAAIAILRSPTPKKAVDTKKPKPEVPAVDPAIPVIDLHATELLDTTAGMSPGDIINYQIDQFRKVMDANLNAKGKKIVFIHGRGNGILRNAILKELAYRYKKCEAQDASFRDYGFGATQITVR